MATKQDSALEFDVLGLNMDEVGDPQVAEEGEHKLEVASMKLELSKKDRPMVVVTARFSDLEDTYPVREWLSYPLATDKPDVAKSFVRRFRNWARALGISDDSIYEAGLSILKEGLLTKDSGPITDGFETFEGLQFDAIIDVQTLDNGGEANSIKKLLIPQS